MLHTLSQDVREEVTDATGEAGDGVGFLRQLRSSAKKRGWFTSSTILCSRRQFVF